MNHEALNKNMDMGNLDMDHVANMHKEFFVHNDYEWWNPPKTGDVVVDVGACVGMFSCMALDKGADKVYMIEPNKDLLMTAIKNTADYVINETESKVVPVHAAILSNDNHVQHIYNEDTSGSWWEFSFDQFIDFYKIDNIDFLKIDCEGGEYDILTKENFEWICDNVNHIALEVHRRHGPSGAKDFKKFRDDFLKPYLERGGQVRYQHLHYGEFIWNDKMIDEKIYTEDLPAEFMIYFTKK